MIVSIIALGGFLYRALYYAPTDELTVSLESNLTLVPTLPTETQNAAIAFPTQLRIPSIKVDANVQDVGITKKGNMATPNNFSDVGWYKYGVVPGNEGSAVVAGHVNNGLALPAVFSDLKDLKLGDDIYVDTVDGKIVRFVVTGMDTYAYDEKDTGEVFNQTGGKFLKLITCTGTFQKDIKTHDKRLVVTAVRVP